MSNFVKLTDPISKMTIRVNMDTVMQYMPMQNGTYIKHTDGSLMHVAEKPEVLDKKVLV